MLKAEEIEALRDASTELTQPIIDYLLADLAERVKTAGEFSATAQYETWKLQQLGLSQKEIKQRVKKLLKTTNAEVERLFTQSAEAGYSFDLKMLPTAEAIPFESNASIQQIVAAAVALAQDDLTNITQTLGMVDPYGKVQPLQAVYRQCMDYAFMQVSTGAVDYTSAIRETTKNLADKGVYVIDYESGVHTTLEAAVRRNIMGGLGLMQEQISKRNHDEYGADGWEIDAHSNSAPDHEPIQGRQYPDAEYEALNNSLVRRIGTLNCGHSAYPIIMGISSQQYTPEQLETMRSANAEGIDYNGKHYTGYEATQHQRALERAIRKQKRRILIDETTGDAEKLETDQIKLQMLRQKYKRFSKAAGLRTQAERAEVAGFGYKQSNAASAHYKRIANAANSMYDTGSEKENIKAYMRDLPIRKQIQSGEFPLIVHMGRQNKHVAGTKDYAQYSAQIRKGGRYGPSRITVSGDEVRDLVDAYKGTGIIQRDRHGRWRNSELITAHPNKIGVAVNDLTGAEADTPVFRIHYSKDGVHVSPDYPSKKGTKNKK
jgi:hypothetical protein